jgi:sugar O-acyltransferase (sialic acid O-acetyltransferase NeuD family)
LQAAGYQIDAVFDDDQEKWNTTVLGIAVRGPVAELANANCRRAVLAIGDNATREKLAGQIQKRMKNLEWVAVVHPRAYLHPSVQLGEGSVVFAGAIIQPDTIVGAHAIVNTAASIDHDCVLDDYVHIAPGVRLAGGVQIGRGSFLGIGAVVIPDRNIGQQVTIGAGAVVVRDIADHVTAIGVPATPLEGRIR